MFKRFGAVGLSAAALLVLSVGPIGAQEALTNLRVVGGAASGDAFTFPDGTKTVTVMVDHDVAGTEQIGISVVALSVPAYSSQKRVSGKGTLSFEITGDGLYGGVASSATRAADSAAQTLALAARGTGMQDYLLSAKGNLRTVLGAAAVLKGLNLNPGYAQQVKTLEDAATAANTRIDEALAVPGTNADEKKAKAVDAQAAVPGVQQAVKGVSEGLAGVSGLPLPKTGDDTRTPLDVAITRDGHPAMSTAILVGTGSLVPAPTATQPLAPANPGSAGSQPTPTTSSSGPGSSTSESVGDRPLTGAQSGTGTGSDQGGTTGRGTASTGPVLPTPAAGSLGQPPATVALGAGQGAQPPRGDVSATGVEGVDSSELTVVGAEPVATWTVAAGDVGVVAQMPPGAAELAGASPARGDDGAAGLNLAVLAVGALMLVGAAVWMRRRM